MTMSEFDVPKKTDVDPAYEKRLFHALHEPIYITIADLSNRYGAPTALDPDNVFVKPINSLSEKDDIEHGVPYKDYVTHMVLESVSADAETSGATDQAHDFLVAETMMQMVNRMDHNREAFSRLEVALAERPADDMLLEIVRKARRGSAELTEMVRLIKEYPEMVSIETSSVYVTAGVPNGYDPIKAAYAAVRTLIADFNDAEVTPGGQDSSPHVEESTLMPGCKTRKRVIATLASVDSLSEMVLKEVLVTVGEHEYLLGVTTYLRTGDHKNRPGYAPDDSLELDIEYAMEQSPELARILLGRLAAGQRP